MKHFDITKKNNIGNRKLCAQELQNCYKSLISQEQPYAIFRTKLNSLNAKVAIKSIDWFLYDGNICL